MEHTTAAAAPVLSPEKSQVLVENTIYLMGGSFVLGCLFTLFLLLVLDFVRRNRIGA